MGNRAKNVLGACGSRSVPQPTGVALRATPAILRVIRALAIAPLVLLCSCQSLPREAAVPAASNSMAQSSRQPLTPTAAVAQRPTVRPVVHHQHAAGQPAGFCPHCGPGTLPTFAFTGPGFDESAGPGKPPGIKGP